VTFYRVLIVSGPCRCSARRPSCMAAGSACSTLFKLAVNLVRAFYLNVSQFVLGIYTLCLEKVN